MDILVESGLRAIVLATGVALLLALFRLASPRIVHRAWAGVAAVMLLLPAIVTWGPEAEIPLLRDYASFATSNPQPDRVAATGIAPTSVAPVERTAPPLDLEMMVVVVYGSGVVFLLLRLGLGIRRARALVREAECVNGRLTHGRCITPVTVGLLAPVVVLPRDWAEWTAAELAAVLAHENEHVRRRDPLVALLTILNRVVFWFHPLAWWLQRKVSHMSEQACDEAVIAQGHDADAYAASLLKFAKSAADGGRRIALVGTAMPGSGLRTRLGMLAKPPVTPPSARRLASVAAAYLGAVVVSSAAMPTTSSQPAASPGQAAFQSASQAAGSEWLVRLSEHFEIIYERQQESRIEDVRRQAEEAYAHVSGQLKYELTQPVALILVRRNRDLRDGIEVPNELVRQGGAPARQRLVISTESLDTRAGIIVHELTHQFAFEIIPRVSRAAPWLIEGLAEHERGIWDVVDYRKAHDDVAVGRIPELENLTSSDRHWAHALFDFVAAEYSAEGVRRFLFALRTRPQPDEAIPAAFAVTPGDFSQAFRAYVTTRFGER